MRNIRAARRYARAVLADAERDNLIGVVSGDLETVGRLVRDSREFRRLITSPVVSAEKKMRILDELLGPRLCKETMAFLHMLVNKHREPLLADIIDQFASLRNEKLGIVAVEVMSAVALTPSQEQALSERLERYTQKKVQTHYSLDPALRGGMVVRIGDTVLDGSVIHQLALLRERLGRSQAS